MIAAPATELVAVPTVGRRFVGTATVRLGDVDPAGELRLDSIARYLQDVASDDSADARVERPWAWVVRRTMVRVVRPARLGEHLRLTTFCSGTGRCWAERRTSITGDDGAALEAAALWVQIDPDTGGPRGLDEGFHTRYAEAAGGRRVSTRLSLGGPLAGGDVRPWTVRAVDLDVLGHVNNAVHWSILEEALAAAGTGRTGTGEMEHLAPLDAGADAELHVATDAGVISAWLVVDGAVRSAARWTPAG